MNNEPTSPPPPSSIPTAVAPSPSGEVIAPKPKGPSFAELGLRPEVLRAVEEMGFTEPMPVQAAVLPLTTAGRDLMVQSRTGSGKTAAFGIPFANSIVNPDDKFVQAVVLLPTRELALQVASELAKIVTYRKAVVVPVYGGAPMGRQVEQLRAGGQIVCGTPGRVLDHLRRGTLKLDRVKCAVLDECDEMLSMGFQEDIEAILEHTPESRQTLLFSATLPEGIQRLSRRFLKNPEFLKLSADFVGVQEIKHLYYSIPGVNRENELLRILNFEDPKSAIIFCNTREETGRVAEFLRKQGFEAEAISSDLSQSDRERVMARMRASGIKYLVATDVAARGIDIENLQYVFNYTFPEAPELYIHRTGRTGRAGKQGTAVSLIGPTEVGSFYYLKLLYKIKPEERALPSEVEIRSRREGERVAALRQALGEDAGGEWKSLARRLMGAVDSERLIAALLARSFAALEGMPAAPAPRPAALASVPASPIASVSPSATPAARDSERESHRDREPRGFRDRGDRPPREGRRDGREARRDRPERTDRSERSERTERPAGPTERPAERPERAERAERPPERSPRGPRSNERGFRPEAAAPPAPAAPAEREFWEVWSDEKAAQAAAEGLPADRDSEAPALERAVETPAAARNVGFSPVDRDAGDRNGRNDAAETTTVDETVARLYLNLGRKDGAAESEIQSLLSSHAGVSSVLGMDVMNTHTYINVPIADADRICAALTGRELGSRELVCERAKPRRR
ncbi:MAG TPA: DEAD/DEAH box helicase [Polyangia bacterium]|jgi:ATP-dependent RNA helicase DeaD